MPDAKTKVASILANGTALSLGNAAKQTLYTCPTGRAAIILCVVLRNVSGDASTGVGGFGKDTPATDFRAAVEFDNLDAAGKSIVVFPEPGDDPGPIPSAQPQLAAGDVFGIDMSTTVGVTCDWEVIGYEIDV